MEENRKLRVGIVGCGYQGNVLAHAIRLVDSLVVTAAADIIPERAVELAAKVGQASAHASMEDLLANSDVDIVMVATPHHVLAPLSLLAIQSGKHVLGEKPCGMTAAEVAEVQESAVKAGVSYLAGYSFRYTPAWYKVHELLEQSVTGEIVGITGQIGLPPMNEGWKASPATGGGPLMYVGSHLIDQVIWYLQDEPVEVYASTHFRDDTLADETSAIQIKFARGAVAQLMVTQTAQGQISGMEIFGRDGSISMRLCGFLDYELKVFSKVIDEYTQPVVLHETIEGDVRDVKHSRQLKEFASAIRARKPTFATALDAVRVMEVIDAVFSSSRSGKPAVLEDKVPA
jgi:predicted dehydrogenase